MTGSMTFGKHFRRLRLCCCWRARQSTPELGHLDLLRGSLQMSGNGAAEIRNPQCAGLSMVLEVTTPNHFFPHAHPISPQQPTQPRPSTNTSFLSITIKSSSPCPQNSPQSRPLPKEIQSKGVEVPVTCSFNSPSAPKIWSGMQS